jgi:hypothetical protein
MGMASERSIDMPALPSASIAISDTALAMTGGGDDAFVRRAVEGTKIVGQYIC